AEEEAARAAAAAQRPDPSAIWAPKPGTTASLASPQRMLSKTPVAPICRSSGPPSDRQIAILREAGMAVEPGTTAAQASQWISALHYRKIRGMASYRWCERLILAGLDPAYVFELKAFDASRLIHELKKNGGRRPANWARRFALQKGDNLRP